MITPKKLNWKFIKTLPNYLNRTIASSVYVRWKLAVIYLLHFSWTKMNQVLCNFESYLSRAVTLHKN